MLESPNIRDVEAGIARRLTQDLGVEEPESRLDVRFDGLNTGPLRIEGVRHTPLSNR